MALNKRCLRGLIEYSDVRNVDGTYTEDDVMGVSTDKRMFPTKADLDGVNLRNYKLFFPGSFAYVADTSRRGDKIALAYNNTDKTYIVSTWYVVFKVCDDAIDILLPDYLYLFFNRSEFDRYARTNSWGSAREYFWFADMEDVEIELPPISIQQKYVDIYKSMIANQQSYERGLVDLKLTLDAAVEKFKNIGSRMLLAEISNESDERNANMEFTEVSGVNKEKVFMPSVASGEDLSKYKIVRKNQLACNLMHVGRDVAIPIALQTRETPIIVSPAYIVFDIDNKKALPQYVLIWFSRIETDRNAWFMCDNNIRGGMEKKRFFEMSIPLPSIEEQQTLVELHEVMSLRRTINERMKAMIKIICPILIKGSLEEGAAQ